MNSVLRKLGSKHLSAGQIADLLEKHIGDDSNEVHCQAALDAIRRIRDHEMNSLAHLISVLQTANDQGACEVVRQIVAALRAVAQRERGGTG